MTATQSKEITIENAFSKGFVQDKARNNIPQYFAGYVRNARIKNAGVTIRPGYEMLFNNSAGTKIQGMVFTDSLYRVAGGFVYNNSGFLVSLTNIGYVGIVDFIVYGDMFIILTGDPTATGNGKPWYYSPATGLQQVTDAEMPLGAFPNADLAPKMGSSFTTFTFRAGNTSGYENVLYYSQPVIVDITTNQPQIQNAHNRSPTTVSDPNLKAKNIMFTSEILAVEANLNNLYVFCKNTVEILGRSLTTNLGGVISFYTQPIANGDEVWNSRIVAPAGERLFYLTSSRKVKTVGFIPGTVDPQIGDLTDRAHQCIGGFMDTLSSNQSDAFGIYVKTDNTVRRHLRSQFSGYNDVCLIYDIINDTFLVDDNKDYVAMTIGIINGDYRVFAGSGVSNRIYIDDAGTIDKSFYADQLIPFEYDTSNISFGLPTKPKQFRGCTLGGGINQFTAINLTRYVDGTQIFSKVITYASLITQPLAANIGGPDISGNGLTLFPFEAVADEGEIRNKGKRIRLKIKLDPLTISIGNNANFYLDYLSFMVRPMGRYDLPDKI